MSPKWAFARLKFELFQYIKCVTVIAKEGGKVMEIWFAILVSMTHHHAINPDEICQEAFILSLFIQYAVHKNMNILLACVIHEYLITIVFPSKLLIFEISYLRYRLPVSMLLEPHWEIIQYAFFLP